MAEKICSVCGKPYEYQLQVNYEGGKATCKHDSDVIKDKVRIKRHQNFDASMMALKLAAEQKQRDKEMGIDIEIPVTSTQKGSAGKIEKIPEKVIKSIEEKVASVSEE